MALYGPLELPRVAFVRPDVRVFGLRVMAKFEARFPGEKLFIPPGGGYRTDAEQAADYAAGVAGGYRVEPPESEGGKPVHVKGAGLDFQVVGTDQNPAVDRNDPRYIGLGEIIESEGYIAGINFRSGLPDPYHSQPNETWEETVAKWEALKKKGWLSQSLQGSSSSPSAGR